LIEVRDKSVDIGGNWKTKMWWCCN